MKKGFTLIELLVVISIIAILAVIGLGAYAAVYRSSRDTQRKSDLKFVQSALENYHSDQIFYPGSLTFSSNTSLTNATGISPAPAVTKTYISSMPSDPTGSPQYLYQAYRCSDTNCTTYVACAATDNASASVNKCVKYCLFAKTETNPPASDPGCTTFPQGYNYGVSKP